MDIKSINANVNRLLSNIWSIITFLKEFTVDDAKDVSITFLNENGTESIKTFPNIEKQKNIFDSWKNNHSKYSVSCFQGLYDPMMPGTATNFDELNELNFKWTNIVRKNVNFSAIDDFHPIADDERFLAQVIRHQTGYHFFSTVGVICICNWETASDQGLDPRLDNQYQNKNFLGAQTEACWVRVPEGEVPYRINYGWKIVWQHPNAKNENGSYNVNNWHLVGLHRGSRPSHTTISFPFNSAGTIELFGYSKVAGHVPIQDGVWFPIHQVGYKNSSDKVGGLIGRVGK